LGRQLHQDVKLLQCFKKWFHPYLQGATDSLVKPKQCVSHCWEGARDELFLPSYQQHSEHGDGVSSWNAGRLSHLDTTVWLWGFYWILSPQNFQVFYCNHLSCIHSISNMKGKTTNTTKWGLLCFTLCRFLPVTPSKPVVTLCTVSFNIQSSAFSHRISSCVPNNSHNKQCFIYPNKINVKWFYLNLMFIGPCIIVIVEE